MNTEKGQRWIVGITPGIVVWTSSRTADWIGVRVRVKQKLANDSLNVRLPIMKAPGWPSDVYSNDVYSNDVYSNDAINDTNNDDDT